MHKANKPFTLAKRAGKDAHQLQKLVPGAAHDGANVAILPLPHIHDCLIVLKAGSFDIKRTDDIFVILFVATLRVGSAVHLEGDSAVIIIVIPFKFGNADYIHITSVPF